MSFAPTKLSIRVAAQRPWKQALQSLADFDDGRLAQRKPLLTLLRAGYHLRHIGSMDELMRSVLEDMVAVLDAQRGCFVLVDADRARLRLRSVVTARRGASTLRCFSRTLAQRCFRQGESLLCQDVSDDDELRAAQSTTRKNMSSIICALLRSPRQKLGVLHLDRGPLQAPFSEEDFFLADALAASVSAGIESAMLVAQQRELFLQTNAALARAVELRDQYTGNHTQRVTDYALLLAKAMHLPGNEQQLIRTGTPLHDIGKIGIDDAVLRKPGPLTREESLHMQTHAAKGAEMLSGIPSLRGILPIIRHHHERWDGQGYPDRLAGEAIPPLARIVAVADAFDAMTSDRPYRVALTLDQAFAEIAGNVARHFDPVCARAFLGLRSEIEAQWN